MRDRAKKVRNIILGLMENLVLIVRGFDMVLGMWQLRMRLRVEL